MAAATSMNDLFHRLGQSAAIFNGPVTWGNSTTTAHPVLPPNTGRITLQGSNADLVINDISLVETLTRIEQRLNILQHNPKLEAEWDQLRELGNQYRELEKQLLEQEKMWQVLKKSNR